jgi:anaerobic magnesium-protoporphyrin IX monomethyl ester cyclase
VRWKRCYLFGKRFRARSADNVIEEVQLVQERYGVNDLEVYDRIFNLDLKRAKAICRGLVELDFDETLAFLNEVWADRLDRELVELLAEAGLVLQWPWERLRHAIPRYTSLLGSHG